MDGTLFYTPCCGPKHEARSLRVAWKECCEGIHVQPFTCLLLYSPFAGVDLTPGWDRYFIQQLLSLIGTQLRQSSSLPLYFQSMYRQRTLTKALTLVAANGKAKENRISEMSVSMNGFTGIDHRARLNQVTTELFNGTNNGSLLAKVSRASAHQRRL